LKAESHDVPAPAPNSEYPEFNTAEAASYTFVDDQLEMLYSSTPAISNIFSGPKPPMIALIIEVRVDGVQYDVPSGIQTFPGPAQ
jgi:hypothetical protein